MLGNMKNIFLCILFNYSTIFCVNAQPLIQWQKSMGGSGSDFTSSIRATTDGGFIIAGTSSSNDSDVTGNHGGRDYWIVKTDNIGNIQWQRSYGGSVDDFANDVRQTSDGGFIIAGYSESNDSDVTANYGHRDFWIVKTDSLGSISWEKNYGGSEFEIPYSVQETFDGGYVVAGYSNSIDGDLAGTFANAQNYWLLKLDNAGLIQWYHLYGGTVTDEALSCEQTSDHGYILAGYTYSSNGHVTGYHGNKDAWIVKTDSTGAIQWQKTLGGTSGESANCIRQTTDGGFIVACTSASNDNDVSGSHGGNDCWIVKLDNTGIIDWQKSLGGSGDDGAYSVSPTTDGGYIIGGYSNSTDGDVTFGHGDYDCWIVKLDGSGNLLWQKSLGGSSIDVANSIFQTNEGGFIFAGTTYSNDGDVTVLLGSSAYWIVKLDSAQNVSVKETERLNADFTIYPNPFTNQTTFSFDHLGNDKLSIEIRDIEGRVVRKLAEKNPSKVEYLWDGANDSGIRVAEGVYFILITSEVSNWMKKVVLLNE